MTSIRPTKQHIEEAMTWLLRLNEAGEADMRRQHEDWLASDPINPLAWRQVNKAWFMLDQVPQQAHASVAGRVAVPSPRQFAWKKWAALAAAACLLLAFISVLKREVAADYSTSIGEVRALHLSDGSSVNMGADSALSVDISPKLRQVNLLEGRAFFDVARDESRPFVVKAGGAAIEVHGTAFDVNLTAATISVVVKRGLVGVRYPDGATQFDENLGPGDRVSINRASGAVATGKTDPAGIADWLDGRLFVVNTPISEVVAELRRYQHGWIVIADSELGDRTVTGIYNLRTPQTALRAMLQPVGGAIRQVTPYLTILSGPEK